MRRDKTAARILLILSVVHAAVAAPAIVRQISLDVAEDVTPASKKRGNPFNSDEDLYPVPQTNNDPATTSGAPPLHNGSPPTPGAPPLQDSTSPALGDPQVHNGLPGGSKAPLWQHSDWRPAGEIVQGDSSSKLESGGPTILGLPPNHEDLPSESGLGKSDRLLQWLDKLPPPPPDSESLTPMKSASPPSSHWGSEVPLAPAPGTEKVSNDALKQGLKVLGGFGAVAGVSAGLSYGIYKLVNDHSHGAYVSAFHSFPADV